MRIKTVVTIITWLLLSITAISISVSVLKASSLGESVQDAGVDWWPMFHHDLSHTGASTLHGPTTNRTLWTYTTGNVVYSSPAVVNGLVYIGSYDKKVYCLNAFTGELVWSYSTDFVVYSSPAVVDGRVYVGSGEWSTYGRLYCLDAADGTLIWSYLTSSFDGRLSGIYSSPAVVEGRVYFGCNSGHIYCLNATTGAVIWAERVSSWGGIISSPAVVDDLVYAGASDGWIHCRNATNGSHVWSYNVWSSEIYSSPAVVDGLVYVAALWKNLGNRIYCLDALTGAHVWNYTTGNWVDSSPAVADGLVYVGSQDKNVYCLNATTGAYVWSYSTAGVIWASSPAVAGGLVYIGSNDTRVYCLNATTGTLVWSYKTGGDVISSPAVAGAVYVGSGDGKVYAFGESLAASISPSSVATDVGQLLKLISTVSGGVPPYTCQWCLNDTPVGGASSSTYMFTPTSRGQYNIYMNVTDKLGQTVKSNTATLIVNNPPSVTIIPTSITINVNQSQIFNSSVTDGTPPYTYQWYLNGIPVPNATSNSWTFTPTSIDYYTVYVNVTDSVGVSAISTTSQVNIIPEFQQLFLMAFFITLTLLSVTFIRRLKHITHQGIRSKQNSLTVIKAR
ncbi:MAG: PQQ-binding-like beta-propeller repeat protein [Candidatus Bathyarchaeia archaeon]